MQRVEVVAIEAELQLGHLQQVEALELHVCLGECLRELRLIVGQQVEGGLLRRGVHDELSEVATRHLRGVGGLEAGRRTADERRDARDALVLFDGMAHAVGHEARVLQSFAFGQEYLNSKLVAVGEGEEANLQRRQDEQRGGDDGHAGGDGHPGMAERHRQHAVVDGLHAVGEPFSFFLF